MEKYDVVDTDAKAGAAANTPCRMASGGQTAYCLTLWINIISLNYSLLTLVYEEPIIHLANKAMYNRFFILFLVPAVKP